MTDFTFQCKLQVGASTVGPPNAALQRFMGIDRLVVENNTIELAQWSAYEYGTPTGIQLTDHNLILAPAGLPPYVNGEVIIRGNVIRLVDGITDPNFLAFGLSISGAKSLTVCDNIVDVPYDPALRHYNCGAITYLNNRTATGGLLRGVDGNTLQKRTDLELEIEDATLLAM